MPAVKTVKIHDPKNPRNIMQIDDPEIKLVLPAGHDVAQSFDPLKHVKVRPEGQRYTPEEEQILAQQQRAYEERRASLGLDRKEPDSRDLEIIRLRRELEEAKAKNTGLAPSSEASSREATEAKPAAPAPEAKKQAQSKEQQHQSDEAEALSGLSGAPKASKK